MEANCTLLIHYDKGDPANAGELKSSLQNGTIEQKIAALKQVIMLTLNGDSLPNITMTIIQFVMPSKDHTLKKLLLLYLEVCEKTSKDGKLLHEMILVCNAIRNDLNHPNEYIRGSTLRFVSKLREIELLEPLIPSVRNNLEHRHAYVRRNAVLAIYNIYKNFEHLLPDAPEQIHNFILNEGDAACQRNAFIMLFNCAHDKAVQYLGTVLDQVKTFGDILQFIVVQLIRKVCLTKPEERSKYLQCIYTLMSSSSPSVQFESSATLLALTSVKAAATTFIKLLCEQSDNNVKMIVLGRLSELKDKHGKIMQELVMDVLRALVCPNMEVRRRILAIALDLVTPQNIDEVVLNLKKEVNKTQEQGYEKAGEYRQLLVQSIHMCAVKFPSVAKNVIHVLMDFLGDASVPSAVDVITFVREVVETFDDLRAPVLKNLLICLRQIKSPRVYRAALWILGEYITTSDGIDEAFSFIKEELGELPLENNIDMKSVEQSGDNETGASGSTSTVIPFIARESKSVVNAVLADGSYVSQSALTSESGSVKESERGGHLRRLLTQAGDFFLGSVLATALTKYVLRVQKCEELDTAGRNAFAAEVLLILVAMLRLGKSDNARNQIDGDSQERITLCIQVLLKKEKYEFAEPVFLGACRESFARMLSEQHKEKKERELLKEKEVQIQADEVMHCRQLLSRRQQATNDKTLDLDAIDLHKATGGNEKPPDECQRLTRVYQLTGLSDPVYAEVYINVHQFDITLEVTVINQTPDTLSGVSLELATMGDLKLCDRPQSLALGPFAKTELKATIKVSSTETGVIFGNIVYDISGSGGSTNYVILNDIHIDIMDYIVPASCSNLEFRSMWAEFEWENKVVVNTSIADVDEYLVHILKTTNMNCLTPKKAREGDCGFLSANLYAKSIFGEDALANLSIEKQDRNGKIQGFIRIRSKTQGIALSLGDKITMQQQQLRSGADDDEHAKFAMAMGMSRSRGGDNQPVVS